MLLDPFRWALLHPIESHLTVSLPSFSRFALIAWSTAFPGIRLLAMRQCLQGFLMTNIDDVLLLGTIKHLVRHVWFFGDYRWWLFNDHLITLEFHLGSLLQLTYADLVLQFLRYFLVVELWWLRHVGHWWWHFGGLFACERFGTDYCVGLVLQRLLPLSLDTLFRNIALVFWGWRVARQLVALALDRSLELRISYILCIRLRVLAALLRKHCQVLARGRRKSLVLLIVVWIIDLFHQIVAKIAFLFWFKYNFTFSSRIHQRSHCARFHRGQIVSILLSAEDWVLGLWIRWLPRCRLGRLPPLRRSTFLFIHIGCNRLIFEYYN